VIPEGFFRGVKQVLAADEHNGSFDGWLNQGWGKTGVCGTRLDENGKCQTDWKLFSKEKLVQSSMLGLPIAMCADR
jgi:hypothetical protein